MLTQDMRHFSSPAYYKAGGGCDLEYRGIDVSSWQGVIDWKKVADHGTEFALPV